MRKIPTLFVRDWDGDRRYVLPQVTPGCEWVIAGEGVPTRKFDGTCMMFDGEKWWARREVKEGKPAPAGFVVLGTDDVCVSCKMAGWEPGREGVDATQVDRGTAGVSQRLVCEEGRRGPLVPGQVERESQSDRSDLRDLRNGIQGPQGSEDVQPGVRHPADNRDAAEAPGQPDAMAAGSWQPREGLDERRGVSDGLQAGSPKGGQGRPHSGTSGGHGGTTRSASPADRDGAPQERPARRQPAGEPGAVDEASAVGSPGRRDRPLRDLHLCRACGVAEVTGKTVGWEPAGQSSFAKHLTGAIGYADSGPGTYELVGPKINGNPEQMDCNALVPHGDIEFEDVPTDFDGLAAWLHSYPWEGIVWHHPDGRMCKIKRRDFPGPGARGND